MSNQKAYNNKNIVVIVVLPEKGEVKFDFLRRFQLKKAGVVFLLLETLRNVVEKDKTHILDSIVHKIYYRGKKNLAPWILQKPAGRIGNTLYSAYDVTREFIKDFDEKTGRLIKEKKEAACRAAICDCFGYSLTFSSEVSPSGEILTEDIIKDLVYDWGDKAKEVLKSFGQTFKRLVLFKDGDIKENERLLLSKILNEIRNESKIRFEVYSVVKRRIERFFYNEGNLPPGTYILLDEDSIFLISSDIRHLRDKETGEEKFTIIPIYIKKEISIGEFEKTIDIKTIAQEFFDLTRLHWQSPRFKMKMCLPLQLVQEMGEYARRNLTFPHDIYYIPL